MIKYKLTEDDLLAAQKLAQPASFRMTMPIILSFLVFVFFVINEYMKGDQAEWVITGIALGITAGVIAFIFVRIPANTRKQIAKLYAEQKSLREEVTFTFDSRQMEWHSASGSCILAWDDVHKALENNQLFLVYESSSILRAIPKRAFDDPLILNALRNHIRTAGSKTVPTSIPSDVNRSHSQEETSNG